MYDVTKIAKEELLTRFNDLIVETNQLENSQERINAMYDLVRFVKYDVAFYAINNKTVEEDVWDYIRSNESRFHLVMSLATTIRLRLMDECVNQDGIEPMQTLADNIAQSLTMDQSTASYIDYETKNRLLSLNKLKSLFRANYWLAVLFLISQIPINHLINYHGTERTE